mmetsp:Transcript_22420/g.45157  ORF Transcript_22420/g.45157 Transcript_22420/m.45157 type:complete len:344 (+) Transcript_22420:209-1240(+)
MYGSMRRQPKSIPSSFLTSASALAISSERRIASERSFAVRLLKRWCTNSLAAFSNRFASESSFLRRALLASASWNSFTLSASWITSSSFSIASFASFIRVLCAFKRSTAWMISAAVSSLRLGFVSSGDGNHRALIASINAAADISSCAFVGSLNQPRSPNIAAGEMQSNPFATSFSSVGSSAFATASLSSVGSSAPTVDVFITTCSSSGLSFFSSTSATSSALTDSATTSSFAFVGSLNHPLKLPHIAAGEQQSNPFAASVSAVGFSVSTVDAFMTTTCCTSSVLSIFSSTNLTSTTSTTCKGRFSSTGASGAAAASGAVAGVTMGVDSIAGDLEFWVRFFLS